MSSPSKAQQPKTPASRRVAREAADQDSAHTTPSTTSNKHGQSASSGGGRAHPVRTTSATGTPISARAAVKKPANGSGRPSGASDADHSEADARMQASLAMEELQTSLRQSQEACENYKKQITLLEGRVKENSHEFRTLEDGAQELHARIDALESEKKELVRSKRELESSYEADREATLRLQKEMQGREEEQAETIRRLKESQPGRNRGLSAEESGRSDTSRSNSRNARSSQGEGAHFAPPSSLQRSDSRSSSRLIHQKDKMIESLRLELAEVQIKIVEMENRGGGQVQELEKHLMESRMTNARLMEENESFQLLLSEKTLNGDLAHSGFLHRVDTEATPTTAVGHTSLEDELRTAEESDHDNPKDLRSQVATLKDENKALTLYINRIISRLLQHDFDFMFDENADTPVHKFAPGSRQKDLPPPPPSESVPETPGLLARTRSIMGSRTARPQSIYIDNNAVPQTVHEDPETAPSIPIGRPSRTVSGDGKRQANNEWNSAAVVNNMYRGISPSRSSTGPLSPGLSSPRDPFSATRPPMSNRVTSGSNFGAISEDGMPESKESRDSKRSSRNSVASDTSNFTSPARSGVTAGDKAANSVMMGGKIRPLRLVQEQTDEAAARKAANRTTWMGWFNKGQ